MIYSTIGGSDSRNSQLLAPKRDDHQETIGITSNEFYHHISHSAKKENKKMFSVREL